MCGIAGFTWSDKGLLKKMTDALAHRGPDGEGFYVDNDVSLGNRRLAIIDLSDKANQPLFNEDGSLIVVCNGEIHNYNELRRHLISKGHRFYSHSDIEVIPHLFEEYGIESFNLLDGMFAFALYEKKAKDLFLVIDHLAIKNIYHSFMGGDLVFASECKAILESERVKKDINKKAIRNIIAYGYNPDNETPFRHIKLLEPGEFLHKSKNKIQYYRYHRFQKQDIKYSDRRLYKLLDKAVQKRLVSDVPVAFISGGGIDSSAVVALASQYRSNLKVFSLGFSKEDNEFYYSRILADKFKLNYTEILLSDLDIYSEMPKVLYHQETPQDTGSLLPNWYLAKEICRRGYKVVLGGDGADESWCGYTRHPGMYDMLTQSKFSNKDVNRLYFEKYILKQRGNPWLFDEFLEEKPWYGICSFFDIFHEIPYYHNIRLDKMFMAWGIEYRPPFLDRELIQFSINIPFLEKIRRRERKYLLKKALSGILPKEVAQRQKHPLKLPQTIKDRIQWQRYIIQAWKEAFGFDKKYEDASYN